MFWYGGSLVIRTPLIQTLNNPNMINAKPNQKNIDAVLQRLLFSKHMHKMLTSKDK